jgi:hypothetical protein
VLILAGLLIYVIVAIVLTKRMSVRLPFCERHRSYWRNRTILLFGGLAVLLVFVPSAVLIVAALDILDNTTGAIICFFGPVAFLVWLVAMAIMQTTSIRPSEITERSITLVGLSEVFVDAVYDDRDAAEEEADRRWRERARDREDAPRGRRRNMADDERYFDPKEKRRGEKSGDDRGFQDRGKEIRRRQRDDDDY